jgi:long-chain acyl-CoA synthetase
MIKENLIKLFESSFRENWDLKALTDYNIKQTYTYGDMASEIAKMHLLFKELNIKKEDKIALVGRNTPTWAITFCSVITYGAIIVPILQDFHPDDIHHIVNHSDSTLLFLSDNIWDSLEEEKLPDLRGIFSLTDFRCLYQKGGETIQKTIKSLDKLFEESYPAGFRKEHLHYADKDNSELVLINYTSGTTGFSKGVMLTGNNLAGNITFGFQTKLTGKGYRILTFLPLAHAYACAFDFLTQVCSGAHVTFLNKIPSPKILLKAFKEVRPNVIFTVPLVIEKIYKKEILPMLNKRTMRLALSIPLLDHKILTEIRKKLMDAFGGEFVEIVIGGAPLNKETEDFLFRIKFPFTVGYGMTECAPLISYTPHDQFIPGSVGKILDRMEVKIDSEDPYNKIGEICVRGENVMCGYYKNKEATESTLQKDGWLRTGDMGIIDKDFNIFIKGRCKTMLLSPNGQNIYPEAIEAKLINMPFVSECIVTQKNDKLVALVYPDLDAMDESGINNNELEIIMEANRKKLNTQIPAYENITKIFLYPNEFEKTPKKSIKRYLYESIS